MLQEVQRAHVRSTFPGQDGDVLLIPPRFSSVFRHKRLILWVTVTCAALALLFACLRHDSYTAVTKLLIDNKTLQLSRIDAVFARSEVDVPLIQNQIELIRSASIANQVIDDLHLIDDPSFGQRHGLFARWFFKSSRSEDPRQLALDTFRRSLYVGRVGDSYVLEIRFTARTAEKAATIANQIGTEYIKVLNETNARLAQSASPWLRTRLRDMGPNASVITAASQPIGSDGPSPLLLLFAGLLGGLVFGITCAFAADARDHSVRTPYQAAAITGSECLGVVPLLRGHQAAFEAVRFPKSRIGHAMRKALAAIREQPDVRTIGVISILPGEGKTTIAANLAQVAAETGANVILIDAGIYSGTLTKLLLPQVGARQREGASENVSPNGVLWQMSSPDLRFLPLGTGSDRLKDCGGIQHVLAKAAAAADLVVVDLSPATLVADLREVASALDGFLLVVEWGTTSLEVVSSALASNFEIQRKLIGVVLNKADIAKLRTYDDCLSVLYDEARYSTYLKDEKARRGRWFKKGAQQKGTRAKQVVQQ